MAQAAEPAQHGRGQRAGQRAVALLERGERAIGLEEIVERTAAADDAVDEVAGDPAYREAGHVGITRRPRPRSPLSLHCSRTSVPGVSRMRCSAQRCTADPGSLQTPRVLRSRVCSAPLRAALRPGNVEVEPVTCNGATATPS